MSNSWIVVSTFVAAALFAIAVAQVLYDWLLRYRLEMRSRVQELSAHTSQGVALFRQHFDGGNEKAGRLRRNLKQQIADVFRQAGVEGTATTLLMWCVACGLTAGAALALWRGIYCGLAAFICGFLIPPLVLYTRRHFRSRALARQLPEAFEMMSRAVRAGQTVPAAIQIIAEDFEAPISEEFKLCYEQQDLGMSREAALHQLAERNCVMELRIFVVALLVQARFGGDLAELLDNLAVMIRKRFKLAQRVRALTGEGRMQAAVLTALPIAAFAGLMLIAPEYMQPLLSRPWLLAATVAAQVAGLIWVQRIIRFDV
jgi:tight adherence protein B